MCAIIYYELESNSYNIIRWKACDLWTSPQKTKVKSEVRGVDIFKIELELQTAKNSYVSYKNVI